MEINVSDILALQPVTILVWIGKCKFSFFSNQNQNPAMKMIFDFKYTCLKTHIISYEKYDLRSNTI